MTDGTFYSPVPPENAAELRAQEDAYFDLADAVRPLIDATLRTQVSNAEAASVAQLVREATRRLLDGAREGALGLTVASDGMLRDHGNPAIGRRNPFSPPLVIDKDRANGRVSTSFRLGAAYEGPPNCVHGGIVTMILDQVLGTVPAVVGKPGMTAYLNTTFKRPTPLLQQLGAEAWLDRSEGWKIWVKGRVFDAEGQTTVEAEGLFVVPKWVREYVSALPQSDAGEFDPPSGRA